VTITGNTFVNVFLSMRGDVSGGTVANNVFDAVAGGNEVIRAYALNGGSPGSLTITGNAIINPATAAGSVGVIRVETSSATIVGNMISGTLAANAIAVGAFSPVVLGNLTNAGMA
jgi:hypothetical protein